MPGSAHDLSVFWNRYAFSVGGIDFLQIDVALAAMAFGEWPRFERRLTEGLACLARATTENQPPSQEAVDDAAIAFRYERDLISGADTTAWLDRTGLSTDAWTAFITRDLLRQMWSAEIEDVLDRYSPSPRSLEAAAWAEGICSGMFAEFEQSLRGKAALTFDADRTSFASRLHAARSDEETASRLMRQHAHWLDHVPQVNSRLRVTLAIKDLYLAASSRLVTDAALRDIVETNRVDWVLIDTDTLSFADRDAACEAMLCVTEERLSIADVGALSRHPIIRCRRFVSDVPPEHRHQLMSVEPSHIVGPLAVDGRFEVTALIARTAPTLDDETVARRARTVLLERLSARAAREHVVSRRPGGA